MIIDSNELARVIGLPRRVWTDEWVEPVTRVCRTPYGTATLKPHQAAALVEISELRGGFIPLPVGAGKTLISFLAPTALSSKRPLLIIPAELRDKTRKEFKEYLKDWELVRFLRTISYELLSRTTHEHFLTEYMPDLIICDEAQKLRNKGAGITKRTMRYLDKNPSCAFVVLSGTITRDSIMDYHHLIRRTHRKMSPLPEAVSEAETWAEVLDNRVILDRPQPGPLLKLAKATVQVPQGIDIFETARQAYRDRLIETPGVIAMGTDRIGAALRFSTLHVTPPKEVQEAVNVLTSTGEGGWTTPDGWTLNDPMSVWRTAREMLMGFYYVWNPRPPREWLQPRAAWSKACREILSNSKTIDTELQLTNALDLEDPYKTSLKNHAREDIEQAIEALRAWREVRDTFEPNTEPRWLSTYMLDRMVEWLKEPGLCWVEHRAFGQRLSSMSGVPFFSQGSTGLEELAGKQAILSIASNQRGKNLQAWNRNIITSIPPNGQTIQQLIGRTHRQFQMADEVKVEFVICGRTHLDSLERAREDALYIQQTTGEEQKILYGDWTNEIEFE